MKKTTKKTTKVASKVIVLTMVLFLFTSLLAGCSEKGKGGSENEVGVNNPTGETSKVKESEPSKNTGKTESSSDIRPISEMPDKLTEDPVNMTEESWKASDLGYEPRILKETTGGKFKFVISVPEIPEDLKRLAKEKGKSYIMIYAKALDGGSDWVEMNFFNSEGSLIVTYKWSGTFYASGSWQMVCGNIIGLPASEGSGYLSGGKYVTAYQNINEKPVEGTFTETSFSPAQASIDALIAGVK